MNLEIDTPIWAEPFFKPARYKGAYGGRGSGKSHFFAEMLIESHAIDPSRRTVCVREIQKSLSQSVKRLLEIKIEALNLSSYFVVQDTIIKSSKGDGLIIFQGLQNHTADSIKSLEGYDCAWVEEAQSLSQRSLDLLRPTIRKENSELWFTWNPMDESDPVDLLLRNDSPPDGAVVRSVNYKDNPFFPEVLRKEMEYDKTMDAYKYEHVWLGDYFKSNEGTIFSRSWFENNRFHLGKEPSVTKYISTDFAVTEDDGDFTELGVFGIDAADNIYILDWWHGQTSSDFWIERLIELIAEHKPLTTYGESGVIKRAIESPLNRRMRERSVYCSIEWITRNRDKVAMARSFQARASMGKVFIPFGEIGNRIIDQLSAFPAGKHDDAVDVCALIGLALDDLVSASNKMNKKPIENNDPWGRRFNRSNSGGSWATM